MNKRYYLYLIRVKLKSKLQYRFAFFSDIVVQFFAYSVTFINLLILLSKCNNINGWTFKEILLLWILNVFSYGISGFIVSGGTYSLEEYISKGKLDNLLTKPASIFWNLMLNNINLAYTMHIFFSSSILIYLLCTLEIKWTIIKVIYTVFILISIICIQASIMIILSISSFWFVKSSSLIDTAIYGLRNFTTYPLTIYGKIVNVVLTFIIPYAFVSYFPANYILGRSPDLFNDYLNYATPAIAIILLIISFSLWKLGLKNYKSTGN